MKVFVTGGQGQLGKAIYRVNQEQPYKHLLHLSTVDVTNRIQIENEIINYNPDLIIHCAAYTNVDKAEMEMEKCFFVNVDGAVNVANASVLCKAKIIFISTDYVFDGDKIDPYEIDEMPNPLNIYGKSKAIAEKKVREIQPNSFIVRTSWMFGGGKNFIKTIYNIGIKKGYVSVVDDQIGSPTYANDLAELLLRLGESVNYGIIHATNEGYCSWADLAEETFKIIDCNVIVKRINSQEYKALAKRPYNSKLSKTCLDKINVQRFPIWQDALKRYLMEYDEEFYNGEKSKCINYSR